MLYDGKMDSICSFAAMTVVRSPSAAPPFTLSDIKNAVPSHCFERSALRSFSYLFCDVVVVSLLVYASTWLENPIIPSIIRWGVLWPLYWFFCGAFATGIWVIAHECGHGAFSSNPSLNDAVGFVSHTLLLVPYYSWKHSHRRHHSNAANILRDEVFVPKMKPNLIDYHGLGQFAVVRAVHICIMLTMGWPIYLLFNGGGRPYPGWANHFNPFSPVFLPKERLEVLMSDVGLAIVMTGLFLLGKSFGWAWLIKTYGIPYLIVNFWLVLITFLQHTHPGLPHYLNDEWDWLRGALSTVDRDYGFLNVIFHRITDTHVTHHLFSKMPHYHAKEATKAVKSVIGPYYQKDNRNIFIALWQDWRSCRYVAPDLPEERILWYRSR